ncbi:MAG: ABC transporter ATP-binding protein [Paenibacillus sp.]|nr:ABC transporter ATP-binding protein [Paenibacillus sp.]
MLKIHSLRMEFRERAVVQDFSLEVEEGEIVSIIGPNGSGKSTILKGVSGMLPCVSGQVCIADQHLAQMTAKHVSQVMCMLCQANISPADMTVQELVGYGRSPHKKWYERLDHKDYEIIAWALDKTGMTGYKDRLMASLSGGEAQRAWLAMALAQRPKLLLLDEPTTYLDIGHQLEVLELVRQLNQELGLTVVMVLHDLNHASTYSDKVCVIQQGTIERYGRPSEVFTEELIRRVYGVETEIDTRTDSEHPRIHVLHKMK